MKQTFTALDYPILPKRLRADDPRVPEEVRAHLGDYAQTIVSVFPVPGIGRIEWMLRDASHAWVDSLYTGTQTQGTH